MGNNAANDIADFTRLFTNYNVLESRYWKQRVVGEQQEFEDFKERFVVFDTRMQALLKKETPFYNIFDILNVRHRETKLHTPFLIHLLNPKASHEQDSLFLNTFLTEVLHLPFTYEELSQFEIHEELSTLEGRLDIIMTFKLKGVKKSIVIENKIYAGDQDKQLDRYYNYLRHDLKLADSDLWLVYLTPRATPPSSKSIKPADAQKLSQNKRLLLIGYHQHIIPWLAESWQHIASVRVQQTVFQYIKTLENL